MVTIDEQFQAHRRMGAAYRAMGDAIASGDEARIAKARAEMEAAEAAYLHACGGDVGADCQTEPSGE